MDSEPIVISGLGVISAAGMGREETLSTFRQGERRCGKIKGFSSSIDKPVFEVAAFQEKASFAGRRTLALVLAAVEEALASARLRAANPGLRVGVCLGTTVASQLNDVAFYRCFRQTGQAHTEASRRFLSANLSEAVKSAGGFSGPDVTVVNACSSGTDAIGMALVWLKTGICDVVIAGGADELNRVPLAGFNSLGILSSSPCRPFDRDRDGLNLGEGAGVLVLEKESTAKSRGLTAEVTCLGYGTSADAFHLTAPRPDGEGLETAVRLALAEAALAPQAVGFVNAHGTATVDNDRVEGNTLAKIFGTRIPLCSTKAFTGHTLGAAGGIEAVFTVLALTGGWLPPTPGFTHPDDTIPLTPTETVTRIGTAYGISTSLAFGGNNSALVFGRTDA